MARIKIDLPATFSFSTNIPVRITDLNYGSHVGNDAVLSIIHEARMQFLAHYGYSEMEFAGAGMIMSDVGIEFKSELFYGDTVIASVTAAAFSKVGFELYYLLEKETAGKKTTVAIAKTGMICYDYGRKKIAVVPEEAKKKLSP
ncbi:MAG: thioesterase family protein [Chitinophagaceae bacterium]|jgi:acyl-CoA thioesterase FadM|nr:thioesterase family protein [Chitinophagaceae bacterium]